MYSINILERLKYTMALIIKSLAVDPPNYDELSDDEDDFVKDPAQYRDQLPQPYRLIDELLNFFLDDVWEKITFQENEKAAELSKIRPPKYDCAVQLSVWRKLIDCVNFCLQIYRFLYVNIIC